MIAFKYAFDAVQFEVAKWLYNTGEKKRDMAEVASQRMRNTASNIEMLKWVMDIASNYEPLWINLDLMVLDGCYTQNADLLYFFVSEYAELESVEDNAKYILSIAVEIGRIDLIEIVLKRFPNIIKDRDHIENLLVVAASEDDVAVIAWFYNKFKEDVTYLFTHGDFMNHASVTDSPAVIDWARETFGENSMVLS